jgi:NADH-quinone oxidoreductase subunit M
MTSNGFPLLTAITFLPLVGVLVLLFMPSEEVKAARYFTLIVTILTFLVSLLMIPRFDSSRYQFQLQENVPWITQVGINYRMGVDGISLWLVLLTTFLSVIAVWFSFYVDKRVKTYMITMLVLETSMIGVFTSLDLILFYTFFEATLVPMYLLINIWGGERRAYAAVKFFIFTFAGSIFMLVGMIALYQLQKSTTGLASFSILDIQRNVANGKIWAGSFQLEAWVFWAFAVAFLVKCPAFPFHTWLPDAHTEAPTAGSVILAGVLLKMGTYGFLRFVLPFFPDVIGKMVVPIMVLAIIGILYGAIVAAVQPDVKRLVAYSSVAHMGFVLIGIFSLTYTGMIGGAMQQLSHGISTGALFLLIGLIYERRHTRLFSEYGGLKAQMPIYAAIFLIVMLSSVGLPGTNGFVGEFLALLGTFQAGFNGVNSLTIWYGVIAGLGVILAAVYLLWMFQKMFYGENKNPANLALKDLKGWEVAMCGLLVLFIFWGGLHPNTFLKPMGASIAATRGMAMPDPNPDKRPVWSNESMRVDLAGRVIDRAQLEARR